MLDCPNCGAKLPVSNPGVVMAVCEYCHGVCHWNEQGVQATGKQSMLSEGFTRLYWGAAGTLRGKRFVVDGRVRYSYGRGFWDEWYVQLEDGSEAWLTEDDHELALQYPHPGPLDTSSVYPGGQISLDGRPFVVTEVGEATCLGVEGRLPKVVLPDETYGYADASSPDGRFALGIEMDDEPPTLFLGEWLGQNDLMLDDEGMR